MFSLAIVERIGEKLLYVIQNGKDQEVLAGVPETSGGFRGIVSLDPVKQNQVIVTDRLYLTHGGANRSDFLMKAAADGRQHARLRHDYC